MSPRPQRVQQVPHLSAKTFKSDIPADRTRDLADHLSVRTTFGLGGIQAGGNISREEAIAAEMEMRRLVARLICADGTVMWDVNVRHFLRTMPAGYEIQNRTLFPVFARAARSSFLTHVKDSDLGTAMFDPVARRAIWAKTHSQTDLLLGTPPQEDKYYSRPLPGALFELRFIDKATQCIAHLSSSAVKFATLLPRALYGRGSLMHVGSIARDCLLVTGQEDLILDDPDVNPDLLQDWSTVDFFLLDRPVFTAIMPEPVRAKITPTEAPWWVTLPPDREKEWAFAREEFAGASLALYSHYNSCLLFIAQEILKKRGYAMSRDPRELYEMIPQVARYVRETGAWVMDYANSSTGSKLCLLSFVERELQNAAHADASDPSGTSQTRGYVDYCELVYDVLTLCATHGIFRFATPEESQLRVERLLNRFFTLNRPSNDILAPDVVAKRPFSELWGEVYEWAKSEEWFVEERNPDFARNAFGMILESVGGKGFYLRRYLQQGDIPDLLRHPLDWWRFLLEIEYLLHLFLSSNQALRKRESVVDFAARHAADYLDAADFADIPGRIKTIFEDWKREGGNEEGRQNKALADAIKDERWVEVIQFMQGLSAKKSITKERKKRQGPREEEE